MGFFSNWPFSNLHNLNLDWLIEQVKKLTVLSEQIWERVKPLPGGDPSTVTAAQAYGAANYAQQTAEQAGASAKTANTAIDAHKANTSNPHQVTAAQVGAEPAFTLLAVAKGGTGGYNPDTARASLNARKDFAILPVSDGGTGSSTPEGARSAIGAKADFDILPVTQGGTGATSADGARTALGALAYSKNQNGNLTTGASDTSAWLTYSVGDLQKCQLDMTTDGNLMVNNKIVPLLGVRIQAGALYAGTAGTTLTFPTPFSGDPYVAICCSEIANVAVTNVTATGCNIRSSVDGNIVRWIAILP